MQEHVPRILEATSMSFGVLREPSGRCRVFIAPGMDDLNFLDAELKGDETAYMELHTYCEANAGTRFPYGLGDTYELATAQLESLLETIQKADVEAWAADVREAFASLREAKANSGGLPWWLSRAFKDGNLMAVN